MNLGSCNMDSLLWKRAEFCEAVMWRKGLRNIHAARLQDVG